MNVQIEGVPAESRFEWSRYVAETVARALRPESNRCRRLVGTFSRDEDRRLCSLEIILDDGRRMTSCGRGGTRAEAVEMAANALAIRGQSELGRGLWDAA